MCASVVCACVHARVCPTMCMEVRGRLLETSSLLPPWVLLTEAKLPGLYTASPFLLGHLTSYLVLVTLGFAMWPWMAWNYVVKTGLEFVTVLLLPLKCGDYRFVSP